MSEQPNRSAEIISPDTQREQRLPPRQVLTRKWPVLHVGPIPRFDPANWDFYIFPSLVDAPKRFSYAEFMTLPKTTVLADMHCVTRWSKLDNLWEGVPTREVLRQVRVQPEAKYVMVHAENGYTTPLALEAFLDEDCLFAYRHNGEDLMPEHGWPLRLVVPKYYAWKSAKWVRGIELLSDLQPGYWERFENGGYHFQGDPWKEERQRPDADYPGEGAML